MKKLISVILVLCMAAAALPVLAESTRAEDVLIAVKGKIDIDEDLTEFNYSENKYDDSFRYDFTWNTKDYDKEVYVTSDAKGEIVSYSYYERMDYTADRSLISYTIADAQPMAEEFVKRLYAEFFEADAKDRLVLNNKKTSSSYSGRYKSFAFTYDRYYMDTPVNSNKVVVRVRATKEKIYVQSVSASLDENMSFASGDVKVSDAEARDMYEKEFPIEFYYAKNYEDDASYVKLYYTINKRYLSRLTGEEVTEERFDRYAYVTEDDSAAEKEFGAAGGTNMKSEAAISPEERAELDNMAKLIAPEEVERTLRGIVILKLTDSMVKTDEYTYKRDGKYFVEFTLESEERYMRVSYNGESGEIIRISSYLKKYAEPEVKVSDSGSIVPEEEIKAFADVVSMGKIGFTEPEFTNGDERSTMSAVRIVNGVRYIENSINVSYDAVNNMVTSYSLSWDDSVEDFPKPESAMSLDEAREKLYPIAGLYYTLVKTKEGYVPAVTLEKGVTINAVTGVERYGSATEKMMYTDIENHWAEDMINVLWEHDVYLTGDKFKPDEEILQSDMLRLFTACRDSGIVPIGWEKDYISEYSVSEGFVDEAKPDEKVTRKEAFDALVNILGYGEIADFDIYKSSYVDLSADGSAEILKAIGVLTGDRARPDDYLTRAEAAAMVYRYLSK